MSTPVSADADATEDAASETEEVTIPDSEDDSDASESEESGADDSADSPSGAPKRRKRVVRTYPAASFKESLPVPEAIQKYAAGQRVRRLTLFEHMGRSVDSGASRQLITNSAQYGLTKGSYSSEFLELTEKGKLASGDE